MTTNETTTRTKQQIVAPLIAGFTAVIVGYAGPTILAFEVATRTGMSEPAIISWFWAYSIGSGLAGLLASWRWRIPIVLAWSTPGLGILSAAMSGHSVAEAIGAYIVVALVITLLGFAGLFERIMRSIPGPIAAAVLAGVLFPFVLKISGALTAAPWLVGSMLLAYLAMRVLSAQWLIAVVTLVGISGAAISGQLDWAKLSFSFAVPELSTPSFTIGAMLDIAVPMLLVTLSGQYLTGLSILKANGFSPHSDKLAKLCGLASLLTAPFGNHTINPAAIIAGIAAGPDSHPDPAKRWWAGISAGITYIVFGSFASFFVALFAGFPTGLVPALAGLALLGSVTSSLSAALAEPSERDAALITFAVTVSGVSYFGISAALWGLIAGLFIRAASKLREKILILAR
jgi:benzoate membrane transport protein